MTSTGTSTGGELSAEERKYRSAAEEGDAADKQAYGEYLVGRGRVDDAVPWLEEAARGGDARAARLRAVTAKDRGQYTVADYWYRTAAERDGDCAFGLAELLLERLDDPEGAAEWYAKGAELGSVKCRTNGALLLLRQGRTEEARSELDEAAPYDHVADHIEDRLIDLGARLDRYEDRIAELAALRALPPEERSEDLDEQMEEFLELEPFSELHTEPEWFTSYPSFLPDAERVYEKAQALGDPRTDHWHALLHYNLDRYEDACRVLEDGLRRYPDSRLLARTLSAVHLQYGELEKYEASLLPGAEAGDRVQQRRLGSYYRDQWRLAEARRWLEAADEGTEGDDDFYEDAADCLEDLEEAEQSTPPALGDEEEPRLAELHEAAESGDPAADLELGRLMQRLCRFPEAVRHYKRAAADPDNPQAPAASYALGRMLHEECGAHEKAVVPLYLPAAKAGDLDAIEGLGALYVRLDEPVKAEPWLRKAARFGRADAASWVGNRVGDDYGDMEEAVRWWTRAAKGGRVWYGWRAGMQLVRWKRYAEAEGLLRLAWTGREEKDPLHEAAYWLGRALRGQGRAEEAVEWLRTARDVHHIVRLGYSGFMLTSLFDPSMELAEALVNDVATQEAYAEAEALLAPVLEDSPKHRTARYLLARIAEQRGDLDAARDHIEQAYTPKDEQTGPLLTAEEVAGVLRRVLG
ncbi:tetratricopeptide repeat protein [Streptomyces oryzae]|uniref:Tetratricopeptide repeat protein n=1 Tax=Streptomyces oryzae TaxID=1434886 RepID=A0ABS3X5F3_9ACTN|nr:tetratricopeptide repeat protein [Streptomyces oryzae]MBO8190607.1 tetratricopeptide repeat protein [Streptomyces oryzae]